MVFRSRSSKRRRPLWRRGLDLFAAVAVLAAVAVVAARLERYAAPEIAGPARVVDGDSLVIDERRLRLKGIDAPELDQRCRRDGFAYGCGTEAASHLRGLIGGGQVQCLGEGVDRYGRDLVRCQANGVALNEAMVRSGHAVAFGDYQAEEELARNGRLGLWAGEFDLPKQWRAVHGGLNEEFHGGLSAIKALLRRLFGV
ncbi:thermonuclease family protein [uncultured Hoeflea sp.]|uniref:thermonuclease family protein n=1 Tax=uncultured Hoeflea sp. TaxID=538666 RepID=UPI00260AA38D|nr:thermonuclease family protein [uncultured Hoeflea sp.]